MDCCYTVTISVCSGKSNHALMICFVRRYCYMAIDDIDDHTYVQHQLILLHYLGLYVDEYHDQD